MENNVMNEEQVRAFLNSIGITEEGKLIDSEYVIQLEDSDEWAKVYSLLEQAENVDIDPDEPIMASERSGIIVYLSDDYDITLDARYDSNTYTLTVSKGE